MSARWFHVTFATYGTWLPGDPRGFRTRHHREHVEGDYKFPPPSGRYDERARHSRQLLVADPVRFSPQERRVVLAAILERLARTDAVVVAVAVGREHVHIVLKCSPGDVRRLVGLAKKHAWFALRRTSRPERIWAKRCRAEPIVDRAHQLNAARYVARHGTKGAAVWCWGAAAPPKPTDSTPWARHGPHSVGFSWTAPRRSHPTRSPASTISPAPPWSKWGCEW